MAYSVKEIFYTLQGEGARSGRPAVFCRFSGCNLWSGREEDRGKGAGGCSAWCDTEFRGVDGPGGGRFDCPEALAAAVHAAWPRPERPAGQSCAAPRPSQDARRVDDGVATTANDLG